MNEYERKRQENIEGNQKILREMGLESPLLTLPRSSTQKKRPSTQANKRKRSSERNKKNKNLKSLKTTTDENIESTDGPRRSNRLANKQVKTFKDVCSGEDSDGYVYGSRSTRHSRPSPVFDPNWRDKRPDPKQFGGIPGVPVGTWWFTRIECCRAGVHGQTVAGIAYDESKGAMSVALSGGYEDDVDWGEAFTYTGSGGRDLKGTKANPKNLRTAPQSKDQSLTGGNLALKISCETKKPIRVIRGYKLHNQYAPNEGYRYDGLYRVEKWWEEVGMSGFKVYKYAFKRLPDQEPLKLSQNYDDDEEDYNDENSRGTYESE